MSKVEPIKNIVQSNKQPESSEQYKYLGDGVWLIQGKVVAGIYSQPNSDVFMKRIKDLPNPQKKVK